MLNLSAANHVVKSTDIFMFTESRSCSWNLSQEIKYHLFRRYITASSKYIMYKIAAFIYCSPLSQSSHISYLNGHSSIKDPVIKPVDSICHSPHSFYCQ